MLYNVVKQGTFLVLSGMTKIVESIQRKINQWVNELKYVKHVKVSRCLKSSKLDLCDITNFNASADAFGSVLYARYKYENGYISVILVEAKSRVFRD